MLDHSLTDEATRPVLLLSTNGAPRSCVTPTLLPTTALLHISFGFTGKAFTQSLFAIQLEQINGSASLWSKADYPFSFVCEVLCPDLRPRVEQGAELSGLRIEGGEIASLVTVRTPAGERQVVNVGRAAVLLRYYVIHLMWEEGDLGWEQTVLA